MPKKVKANGKTFTFDDNVTNEQISIAIDEYFGGVKKKVVSEPTVQKKQLVSPTKQQITPTSSDIGQAPQQQASDGLGGPPEMRTIGVDITPEQALKQPTTSVIPTAPINKFIEKANKIEYAKELVSSNNTQELKRLQNEGELPPDSELIAKGVLQAPKIKAGPRETLSFEDYVYKAEDVLKGGPVGERQVERIASKDPKDLADYKAEVVKATDLNIKNPYLFYSTEDSLVDKIYGENNLLNIGVDPKDFDGFLNNKGYKDDYLKKRELGVFKETNGDPYKLQVAVELEKKRMLDLYLNDIISRDLKRKEYNKEISELNVDDSYKINEDELKQTIDKDQYLNYIDISMPTLSKKLKDADNRNRQRLQDIYDGKTEGWSGLGYGIKETAGSSWNGFVDRINQLATTLSLTEKGAEQLRQTQSQRELERTDTRGVGYVGGKSIDFSGNEYLVDDIGNIYDKKLKIRITDTFDQESADKLRELSKTEGKDDWIFSPQGASIQLGGVVGDMIVQLAATRGFGLAGKGAGMLVSDIATYRRLAPLKSIGIKQGVGDAIVSQAALGYSSGMENTLKQAKLAGLNDRESQELASIAAKEMAGLYAITAPLSPQTKATNALFGAEANIIVRDAIEQYKKIGVEGFKATFNRAAEKLAKGAVEFIEEGGKETIQENIQQAGEIFLINKDLNEKAKKEFLKADYTADDIVNTSILSFISSGLMSQMKAPNLFSNTNIDNLRSLKSLSENETEFNSALRILVDKGNFSQTEADALKKDVDIYKRGINKIPKNTKPDVAFSLMKDVDELSSLEENKKQLDPAFHLDIDEQIKQKRIDIQSKVLYSNLNDKQKTTLKNEAKIELGDNVSEQAITDKAIELFKQSEGVIAETIVEALTEQATTTEEVVTPKTIIENVRDNYENNNLNDTGITFSREGFNGDILNDYEFLAEGSEHTVYVSKDGKSVIKIAEPYSSDSGFMPRVEDAINISNLIGDNSLEVIGYYENNGVKNPVYRQNYIDGTTLTQEEVSSHLESKGFTNLGNNKFAIKVGDKIFEISDTSDNFIKDNNGNIYAIDAGIIEISENDLTENQKQEVVTKEKSITPTEEVVSVKEPSIELSNDKKYNITYDEKGNVTKIVSVKSGKEIKKFIEYKDNKGQVKLKINDIFAKIEKQNEKQKPVQPERTGDRTGRTDSREITPLEGTPTVQGATGPNPQLVAVAEQYAADNGIDLKRQSEYVEVDEDRAKRIANSYEEMANNPQDSKVKEAYAELIKQTKAQYQALVDAGYKFWFMDLNIPSNVEYAESPYNAMRDLRQNKEMGVFPTTDGFGTDESLDVSNNPLLEDTGIMWAVGGLDGEMKPVLANDLFRAVHDAFGHGLEGAGFRARGEENAFQAHSRLYTGSAIGAMASETRGQNSWVNYGPYGEQNRNASAEETIFADQKTGLMPEWTWMEGMAGDIEYAEQPSKTEEKINIAEAKIDDIANWIKQKLPSANINPNDYKAQGFSQNQLIDIIADAAKKLVATGIEISEAINKVIDTLKQKFDFDVDIDLVRERLVPPVTSNDINEITASYKEAGFSDLYISNKLKDAGFSPKESTDAILNYNKQKIKEGQKKENVFIKEGRNIVSKFLDNVRRRAFSARAFLPKSVFISKENKEARIASEAKKASYLVRDFDNELSKYKGDKDALIVEFDKYIRGEKADLPIEFLIIAKLMRKHIDRLSRELIDSGVVDEYQAERIAENLGKYLTRSYEVFDKKDWAKKVNKEILQSAKNFFKKQLLEEAISESKKTGLDVDTVLEKKVTDAINKLIDREGATGFISSGKTGAKDISILKEKTDIPLELRQLMGEYTDPTQNYSRTIFKVASLIHNAKFLNEVKKNGMGVFFFDKNDINKPKEFNTQIAAEGSETMNPLNGLYTTKEIAESFKEATGLLNAIQVALPYSISGPVKSTYEYYMKLLSGVKWAKTIGSVGTHGKNISGNISFMLANGYISPELFRDAAKVVYNDFANKSNEELRAKMNEYIEAGIVSQSATLGEIRAMFKDANFDKSFERRMTDKSKNPVYEFMSNVKKFGVNVGKKAELAYQSEDDYFKIVAYEAEKKRYSNALYGKDYSELTKKEQLELNSYVSEIVKNVLPNYGRVAGAVKLLKAFPVAGTFISFQTEALRTAYNTVALATTEIKSKNPEIRKIGAKRMVGIVTSQAIKYGLMYMIGQRISGDDDDETKKKSKKFVAPWSKKSNVIITEKGNGKFSYIDISASDPHGGIAKIVNAALQGKDPVDGFIEGIQEIVSPFTNPDILASTITELKNNKDANGRQIYNEYDTTEDKLKKISQRLYKTLEPGTATSLRKIYESNEKANEMLGQFTGYKEIDVDVSDQFSFKISEIKKKETEARNVYNKAFNKFNRGEINKEELDKAYNQSNKIVKELYNELSEDYDAAIYFGADEKNLEDSMKRQRISKSNTDGVISGEIPDIKIREEEEDKGRESSGIRTESGSRQSSGTRTQSGSREAP